MPTWGVLDVPDFLILLPISLWPLGAFEPCRKESTSGRALCVNCEPDVLLWLVLLTMLSLVSLRQTTTGSRVSLGLQGNPSQIRRLFNLVVLMFSARPFFFWHVLWGPSFCSRGSVLLSLASIIIVVMLMLVTVACLGRRTLRSRSRSSDVVRGSLTCFILGRAGALGTGCARL